MNFDTQEQKTIILEALNEYHGRGCGNAGYVPMTLGQSAQLLVHVQSIVKGEVLKKKEPKNQPAKLEAPPGKIGSSKKNKGKK